MTSVRTDFSDFCHLHRKSQTRPFVRVEGEQRRESLGPRLCHLHPKTFKPSNDQSET